VPTLDLPRDELESFSRDVLARFRNPFIKHQLLSIALNGMTKYKTRILPQLLTYQDRTGRLPVRLTFALAALLAFYQGKRGDATYPLQDDAHWLEHFAALWPAVDAGTLTLADLVKQTLSLESHWGEDLTRVKGLVEAVCLHLMRIRSQGMRAALTVCS